MLCIKEAVIVEGKYDKIKLSSLIDALIVTIDGFGIYDGEKLDFIRSLAKDRGVIIFTDSDRAGFRLRNYLKGAIGEYGCVKHAYIPEIEGKEKRKPVSSKDGLLGVEGMPPKIIADIFKEFAVSDDEVLVQKESRGRAVTKADFYAHGLSGTPSSRDVRQKVALKLGLPAKISSNALLEVFNTIYDYDFFLKIVSEELL